MSWLEPTRFEEEAFNDAQARFPDIMPLARLLAPAPRIEPLLLRNVRVNLLRDTRTETEYRLWFSPLVSARSSREILFYPGVASLLIKELRQQAPDSYETAYRFACDHTRHWRPEDRLELELRHHALLGDAKMLRDGLRDILRRISQEQDERERLRLARWAKETLPQLVSPSQVDDEARLLAHYAAQALGGIGDWTSLAMPQALPNWLAAKLPPPLAKARLAVEVRQDAGDPSPILHCVAPENPLEAIEFPTPLPARLHVQPSGEPGAWHAVAAGSRILLPAGTTRLRLTTLAGLQYEITARQLEDGKQPTVVPKPVTKVFLSHVESDDGRARQIAAWLSAQGMRVERVAENAQFLSQPGQGQASAPLLRLWTANSDRFWAGREAPTISAERVLILRSAGSTLPAGAAGAGSVLELPPDLDRDGIRLIQQLHALLAGEPQKERLTDSAAAAGETTAEKSTAVGNWSLRDDAVLSDEILGLLQELSNPDTEPPRRLAIGDRLAELGDPRPGVGVKEFDAPDFEEAEAKPAFRPEIQRLLAEWNDPATEPPRRLAIGDQLAEIGDSRPGVGLDGRGLPDIAWVGIPGGAAGYESEVLVPDKSSRSKRPARRLVMPGFHLARYPVTNAQFQAFVDAGGYEDPRWWAGLQQPKPIQSYWEHANRPRTHVDWYEATAFCRWLSAQRGYEVRLPTEQEWEWAARGAEGRPYPWGDGYRSGFANINEIYAKAGPWYLQQTTAAGAYPQGCTPQGVADLAGNVWEWCANDPDHPGQSEPVGKGRGRALRGGSWVDNPDRARADYRVRDVPVRRLNHVGFRVCSSAHIE